jgi:phenylalanyl-tRNA synthetase alpha chain
MTYSIQRIQDAADTLRRRFQEDPAIQGSKLIKSDELKSLYAEIPQLPPEEKAAFGRELNQLKSELIELASRQDSTEELPPIDVTAPFDVNIEPSRRPRLLPASRGSKHPLLTEIERTVDILQRMGFEIVLSRQIDDDYHMFESLNFPDGHPARDDYDTFMTEDGYIAPAHTSTMQNRVLRERRDRLENDELIQVGIPGRVFRNEDLDVTHEHTFYQLEGVVVGKGIHTGHLVATLKAFLSEYFGEQLEAKIQPFYFPFTEPSFEFAIERPIAMRKDDSEEQRWLELLGCGMIHPNVLEHAGIDPVKYTGFAWGGGIDRLVMMKYGIEDVRHFESGKLSFLRQFI